MLFTTLSRLKTHKVKIHGVKRKVFSLNKKGSTLCLKAEGRYKKRKKKKKYTEKTTKENLIFMSLLDDDPL